MKKKDLLNALARFHAQHSIVIAANRRFKKDLESCKNYINFLSKNDENKKNIEDFTRFIDGIIVEDNAKLMKNLLKFIDAVKFASQPLSSSSDINVIKDADTEELESIDLTAQKIRNLLADSTQKCVVKIKALVQILENITDMPLFRLSNPFRTAQKVIKNRIKFDKKQEVTDPNALFHFQTKDGFVEAKLNLNSTQSFLINHQTLSSKNLKELYLYSIGIVETLQSFYEFRSPAKNIKKRAPSKSLNFLPTDNLIDAASVESIDTSSIASKKTKAPRTAAHHADENFARLIPAKRSKKVEEETHAGVDFFSQVPQQAQPNFSEEISGIHNLLVAAQWLKSPVFSAPKPASLDSSEESELNLEPPLTSYKPFS